MHLLQARPMVEIAPRASLRLLPTRAVSGGEIGGSIGRPCLGYPTGHCPAAAMATRNGRCDDCRRRQQNARNSRPARAIYSGDWPAISRAAREAQPWCGKCYTDRDLTLDHGGAGVLCRSCHDKLEAERRGLRKTAEIKGALPRASHARSAAGFTTAPRER